MPTLFRLCAPLWTAVILLTLATPPATAADLLPPR